VFPLLFLGSLLLILAACSRDGADPDTTAGNLREPVIIDVPATVIAGDEAQITIRAPGLADGTPLTVLLTGTFGSRPYTTRVEDEQALVDLSTDDTRHSGLVTVIAGTGSQQGQASFKIEPGPAVGSIPVRIGPRSVPANGQSETMLVAFPTDEWGNPVPADTAVTVRVEHPGPAAADQSGKQEVIKTTAANLLAWTKLKSGTAAGQTRVAVMAGQAHSPEKVFREIPGPPVTFTVNAAQTDAPADGRQLIELTTSQITDRFGNAMLDGTSMTFLATAADGSRRSIPATVIDGVARAVFQAPVKPVEVVVQAVLAGVTSEPLTLSFGAGPAVEAISVATTLTTDTLEIKAGPLVGPLGQFIPDGTPVTFQLISGDELVQELVVPAYYGYATAVLRRAGLESTNYDIQVMAGTGRGQTRVEVD
jgi:hypothetical protein